MNVDINVIASGSTGNAVRIENIMIDCGVPYAKIKKDLYKCDTLLITHSHIDHVKRQTLMTIKKEFPRIKIYANYDVAYQYPVDEVISSRPFNVGIKTKTLVYPFSGTHDVPVTYFAFEIKENKIIYATDTSTIKNEIGWKFDIIMLESNYDERKIFEMRRQFSKNGYDPAESSLRHLSTQKCKEFYYVNRKNKDSILIELHQSKRFY